MHCYTHMQRRLVPLFHPLFLNYTPSGLPETRNKATADPISSLWALTEAAPSSTNWNSDVKEKRDEASYSVIERELTFQWGKQMQKRKTTV